MVRGILWVLFLFVFILFGGSRMGHGKVGIDWDIPEGKDSSVYAYFFPGPAKFRVINYISLCCHICVDDSMESWFGPLKERMGT